MEHTYIVIQISGFILVTLILGGIMLAGFRRSDAADRNLSERFAMVSMDNAGLMKEMSRKNDLLAEEVREISRKTDEAIGFLREQSILNRQILERVDKGR
jgi:hypothetical protein